MSERRTLIKIKFPPYKQNFHSLGTFALRKTGYKITPIFIISETGVGVVPGGYVPHKKSGHADAPSKRHLMVLQKASLVQIGEIFRCTDSLEDDFVSSGVFVSLFLEFAFLAVVGNIGFA